MRETYKTWTADESEAFTSHYIDDGMSLLDSATAIGKSIGSARSFVRNTGIAPTYANRVKLKNPQLSPVELAYLAGIIDGEGSVKFWHNRKAGKTKPGVTIATTSPQLMDWMEARLDLPDAFRHAFRRPNNRPAWSFTFQGIGFLPLYEALLPYMVIKREEMTLLIQFSHSRLSKRILSPISPEEWEIVERCKVLKRSPSVRFDDSTQ